MDGTPNSILADDLYARLGTASAPTVLDVRRNDAFNADDRLIVSAVRCDVASERHWLDGLPTGRPVVVYCTDGGECGQGAAAALRKAGWQRRGVPTHRKFDARAHKWVTRERPKIDRIACPWLIRRFIDPRAEFIYAAAREVLSVAAKTGATPFDVEGVEFAHEGDRCSMAAYRHPGVLSPMLAGTLGGLLATWVTFTPCFLWIFLDAPFVETLRANKAVGAALAAITAAVVGVILNLAVWFAVHNLFRNITPFALSRCRSMRLI